MVVALGPGRFYGSSLPRPRFFPGDRVDPPAPVTDPLLAWAREAHWSMGGLSSKRLRLQGRIEGSIVKLRRRVRRDARAAAKARAAGQKPASLAALGSDDDGTDSDEEVEVQERILKRKVVDEEPDSDESEEDNEEEALATIAAAAKRKRGRKLGDEFDHIAALQHEGEAKKQKPPAASPARTSPRGKAAAVASTPAAGTPAGTSPKSKAAAAAAAAASTPVAGARRTSSRNKHSLRCSLHVQF